MGIFEDFERFCNEEQNRVEVPTVNVYDHDYIKERIRVTKNNQIRNRFRLSNERRFAVRVTGLDHMTHEPVSVMDCYLLGELCMTRHPQFYTKPIKSKNYIIFEDEAVINGARKTASVLTGLSVPLTYQPMNAQPSSGVATTSTRLPISTFTDVPM